MLQWRAATLSYENTITNVFGGTATEIGKITSITAFYASTKVDVTGNVNGSVVVYADVYTIPAGEDGEYAYVGFANDTGNKFCSIDQTATTLPLVGTYAVRRIDVNHQISQNNDDNTTTLISNGYRTA